MERPCLFDPFLIQMVALTQLSCVALPFAFVETAFEEPVPIRRVIRRVGLKERSFCLLVAILSIESIICYYVRIFDPSNTYKPQWTEFFG